MGIKLEIGCGLTPREGYEHLDIQPFPHIEYVADAMHIPLGDKTVSEIYTVNTIEHFWWFEIEPLLKEWYRVMENGGLLTVYTVDSEQTFKDFYNGGWKNEVDLCPKEKGYNWIYRSDTDRNMWLNFKLHGTNNLGDAHRTTFTFEMMKTCMEIAGFKDVQRIGESNYVLGVTARRKDE